MYYLGMAHLYGIDETGLALLAIKRPAGVVDCTLAQNNISPTKSWPSQATDSSTLVRMWLPGVLEPCREVPAPNAPEAAGADLASLYMLQESAATRRKASWW
jgi:hypothetical protein